MSAPIVLLTDFGVRDPYVGVMKGVIARIAPGSQIIDLTHEVPPQDLRAAALLLDASVDWFPQGSIFLCVVDPGVGTTRRILSIRTEDFVVLAPDNGLTSLVIERHPPIGIVDVQNPVLRLPQVSRTFHGRDILAPAAAHLAMGLDPDDLGPRVTDPVILVVPEAHREGADLVGEVIYVDRFGNLVSNLREAWGERVILADRTIRVVSTYGEGMPGEVVALMGSFGRLEVSVVNGNAARLLDGGPGMAVRLTRAV